MVSGGHWVCLTGVLTNFFVILGWFQSLVVSGWIEISFCGRQLVEFLSSLFCLLVVGVGFCGGCFDGSDSNAITDFGFQEISKPMRLPRFSFCTRVCERSSVKRVSRWIQFVFVLSTCRIGEAAVPGPGVTWTLGTCNPGGMAGKQAIFDLHPCDLWAICETHLTSNSVKQVLGGLRNAQCPYNSFVHGCSVLPRTTASEVGSWAGVGVLSKFPSRPAPHSWPLDVFSTSRIVAVSSFVHDFWVLGCVVYGTPYGATHVRARDTTNHLLRHAVDRLMLTSGPRYLAGDLNHDHAKLPELQRLRSCGFIDIQDLHCLRTGILPSATCRHKTRRDYGLHFPRVSAFVSILCLG